MRVRDALTPSFRNRLRLFFVVIVIVPMIAVAVVLFRLVVVSDRSQIDAKLAGAERVAQTVYEDDRLRAAVAAAKIGKDQRLANARERGARAGIERRLDELAEQTRSRYVLLQLDVRAFESGALPAMASARSELVDAQERPTGEVTVSAVAPERYADRVQHLTGAHVVVNEGGEPVASTMADPPARKLPPRGAVELSETDFRITSFRGVGAADNDIRVSLLMPEGDAPALVSPQTAIVLLLLLGFLALAVAFAVTVSRTLSYEIQRLLEAAQRLGGGDFSVAVPAEGNDEFAALGKELN